MYEKREIDTISLKDILFALLYAWKLLVVCLILAVLLFFVIFLPKHRRTVATYNEKYKELTTEEEWRNKLTSDQISAIDAAVSTAKLVNETEEYIDQAIKMQLDPYNVATMTLTYKVGADNGMENTEPSVKNAIAVLSDDAFIEYLASNVECLAGINYSYIREIITITADSAAQFTVKIRYIDADNLELIGASADMYVVEIFNKVKDSEISISETVKTSSIIDDADINNYQNTMQQKQTTYTNQVATARKTFRANSSAQANLFEYILAKENGDAFIVYFANNEEPETPNSIIKTFIIVLIGAGLIWCGVVFVKLLLNSRLKSDTEIAYLYDVDLLGFVLNGRKLFYIDKLIQSLRIKRNGPKTSEERLELLTDNVIKKCQKVNVKDVVFISSLRNQEDLDLMQLVALKLKEAEINVKAIGNAFNDMYAIKELRDDVGVVVFEKVYKSLYADIENELHRIESNESRLLGAAIIE